MDIQEQRPQLESWLRLIRDQRFSRRQKNQLLDRIGSPYEIYQCSETFLKSQINGRVSSKKECSSSAMVQADLAWLDNSKHGLLTISDRHYPDSLRHISEPPIALFAKGELTYLELPKVAVVGSRRPSPVGQRMTKTLASGLASLGIAVVSGMALGVDGLAHQAALSTHGPTIAVMGAGLDTVYPDRHRELFRQIAVQGLILSEYPVGYTPTKHTFPERNRIVSGLSLGAIIIEAGLRSGTSITARLAMEQNREVLVLPGSPVNAQYAGSNALIQQGASLITCVEDVLQELRSPLQSALGTLSSDSASAPLAVQDESLLKHIFYESTAVDQIILASGLTAAEVSSMLLMLELEGAIAVAEDGGYMRIV